MEDVTITILILEETDLLFLEPHKTYWAFYVSRTVTKSPDTSSASRRMFFFCKHTVYGSTHALITERPTDVTDSPAEFRLS